MKYVCFVYEILINLFIRKCTKNIIKLTLPDMFHSSGSKHKFEFTAVILLVFSSNKNAQQNQLTCFPNIKTNINQTWKIVGGLNHKH